MKIAINLVGWAIVGYIILSLNLYQRFSGEYKSLSAALKNPSGVISLDLSKQNLTELPSTICELYALEKLRVSYNRLTELPDCIGGLQNLEELRVGYNRLTDLPASIANLSNLGRLHIGYNPLTKVPAGLRFLNNLYHLGCNETEIPRSELNELRNELPQVRMKY